MYFDKNLPIDVLNLNINKSSAEGKRLKKFSDFSLKLENKILKNILPSKKLNKVQSLDSVFGKEQTSKLAKDLNNRYVSSSSLQVCEEDYNTESSNTSFVRKVWLKFFLISYQKKIY